MHSAAQPPSSVQAGGGVLQQLLRRDAALDAQQPVQDHPEEAVDDADEADERDGELRQGLVPPRLDLPVDLGDVHKVAAVAPLREENEGGKRLGGQIQLSIPWPCPVHRLLQHPGAGCTPVGAPARNGKP